MTIDDKIRNEEPQYNTNRDAEKVFSLSSGKIDKYEYLTVEDVSPSSQKKNYRTS